MSVPYSTYMNRKVGVKIEYPAHWWQDDGLKPPHIMFLYPLETVTVTGFFSPPYHGAGIMVSAAELEAGETFDLHVKNLLYQLNKDPKYKLVEHEKLVLPSSNTSSSNHLETYKIIYLMDQLNNKPRLKHLGYYTSKNGIFYFAVYMAEESLFYGYLSLAQLALDSFEILN